jgi:hypothetical protein
VSVGFARAVEQGLRHNGVPVSFEPGWETRGNGQSFPGGKPLGLITHHTGADYGTGLSILVRGRPDLPGPLCNACTYPDGRIHLIAAHPANHAGASGGRSMGPLPTTTLFNRVVWGNEVMFPGTKPWTPQQYRSARVLAGVICGILGYRDAEHCRSHAETSRTGKWDPGAGRGPGIPFDMNVFRREVWDALTHNQPATKGENMIETHRVRGTDNLRLICPTGKASAITAKAWISGTVDGPETGRMAVFFQSDTGGISDVRWEIGFRNGRSDRRWADVPDGTTQINVEHALAGDGTITLEVLSK